MIYNGCIYIRLVLIKTCYQILDDFVRYLHEQVGMLYIFTFDINEHVLQSSIESIIPNQLSVTFADRICSLNIWLSSLITNAMYINLFFNLWI